MSIPLSAHSPPSPIFFLLRSPTLLTPSLIGSLSRPTLLLSPYGRIIRSHRPGNIVSSPLPHFAARAAAAPVLHHLQGSWSPPGPFPTLAPARHPRPVCLCPRHFFTPRAGPRPGRREGCPWPACQLPPRRRQARRFLPSGPRRPSRAPSAGRAIERSGGGG